MAITPLPALDRTSVTFKADVDTFFGSQLPTFSTETEAARADIVIKQGQAATSATNAATSESNALTSKNAAATSAGASDTARAAAQTAQTNAQNSFISFDDRYLGAKAVAPTLDNYGVALITGALYWDTVLNGGCLRVWQGAWVTIPANVASAITSTPAGGVVATNVQAAINELDTKKAAKGANSDITSLAALVSINGGQLAGMRNRIINGDMRIDQRNAGGVSIPFPANGLSYTVDRFCALIGPAGKLNFQQVADAPPGFTFSTKIAVVAQYAPAAADLFSFQQRVEGFNIVDFGFGTATPAQITASLYVKGSVPGAYNCHFYNLAGTRMYTGAITVTTSWARQSVTLTADNAGAWEKGNLAGLMFGVDLGSGVNANGATGVWQAGVFLRTAGAVTFVNQVAGATLNLTGFQIELGAVASPFEQRPIGMEFVLCHRYYWQLDQSTQGIPANGLTNGFSLGMQLPVRMRGIPTITSNITDANFTPGGAPSGVQWGLQVIGVAAAAKTGTLLLSAAADPMRITLIGYGATLSQVTNMLVPSPGTFLTANAEL